MASGVINVGNPNPDAPVWGPTVQLTNYTSASNMYTAPRNGMIGVRLSGGKTGSVLIYDTNGNIFLRMGQSAGAYVTYCPKGMKMWVEGAVDAAYFVELT